MQNGNEILHSTICKVLNKNGQGGACIQKCSGSNRCAAKNNAYEWCAESGDWINVPCNEFSECRNGACMPTCNEGEKQCFSQSTLGVCKNKEWLNQECSSGQLCENGVCITKCKSGETKCTGRYSYEWCSWDGKWQVMSCPSSTVCTNNACRPSVDGPRTVCDDGMQDCAWFMSAQGGCPNGKVQMGDRVMRRGVPYFDINRNQIWSLASETELACCCKNMVGN